MIFSPSNVCFFLSNMHVNLLWNSLLHITQLMRDSPWRKLLHLLHMIGLLPIVRGGGGFSVQFSGIIIFNMELYYGDQLCSKCIRKSFVSYPVNDILAYKYNSLMTLQSAIPSTFTVIPGILVCIVVRLPIGLPPAP